MNDRMKLSSLGGKIVEPKDRLNALEVALNNEMKERAFYMKHAQRGGQWGRFFIVNKPYKNMLNP